MPDISEPQTPFVTVTRTNPPSLRKPKRLPYYDAASFSATKRVLQF